jgi:hypothetical protein
VQPRSTASNLPGKKSAPPVPAGPRFARQVDLKRVGLAAGVLAILAAAAVWVLTVTFRPGPVQRLPDTQVDGTPYPLAPEASPDTERPAAPAPARATNRLSRPPQLDAQRASSADLPEQASPGSADLLASAGPSPATPTAAPRPAPIPAPELRFEAFEQVRDEAVYTARDAGVTPPIVIFPKQLGRMPLGARREDLAMIEVLVNADGRVAEVKAQESPQSLDDALVLTTSLSAAKSWLFQPAQREGRPVRYRQVLPVSLR